MVDENKLNELLNSEKFKKNIKEHTREYAYGQLLFDIDDEDLRIEIMDYLSDKLSRFIIIDIIKRINNFDKMIEEFNKYINRFTTQEFMQLLQILDEDKQEWFVDTYIDQFDLPSLYTIWSGQYKMKYMGINRDKFLEKYIDKFDQLSLQLIIRDLVSYEYDFISALYILSHATKNEETIDRIESAAEALNPYYKSERKK